MLRSCYPLPIIIVTIVPTMVVSLQRTPWALGPTHSPNPPSPRLLSPMIKAVLTLALP
jgi:hypothetical protein